MLYTYNFM